MTPPKFVMWVDPGLVSGWAAYDWTADAFTCGEENLTGIGERIRAVATAIPVKQLAVGCEDYLAVGKTGTPRYSFKVIGMVEWLAHDFGFTMLPLVPSGMRKLGSVNKLKTLGWHKPTPGGHAIDASRHLLSDMLRNHRTQQIPERIHDLLFRSTEDVVH